MVKARIISNSQTLERTDWFSSFIDPFRNGNYEILQNDNPTINTAKWENGSWSPKVLKPFRWRGITPRQHNLLIVEKYQLIKIEDNQPVPCFSCGKKHYENENDLLCWSGQYVCPDCGEGWIMFEDRWEIEEEE
jgi:hypothetical protein